MFHRRAVKVERSPTTPLSPPGPSITSSTAPSFSRMRSPGHETRSLPSQRTTASDPRFPPGSHPNDSNHGNGTLTPLPRMLQPPHMSYNEGESEPRLSVGPPVSLDLAIRQRVFQNAILESQIRGIRATDTTLFQAATQGQLHSGGYTPPACNPNQYAQRADSHPHQNPESAGARSRDNVYYQAPVTSYLWPQGDNVKPVPNTRPGYHSMPVSNIVHSPHGGLHKRRGEHLGNGGSAQTRVKLEKLPAGASNHPTKESHGGSLKVKVATNPTQKKTTPSSEVHPIPVKSEIVFGSFNPFANTASVSTASASAEPDDSVSPHTITAPSSVVSPRERVTSQERQGDPPSKTTASPNDDGSGITGVEALQAQRNEELEPRPELSRENVDKLKHEIDGECIEGQVKREGSTDTIEMEVC
ncbi:hypothetical protein DFP73DRAFT_541514 [Morchella snyderi]|nr:hypothetical protein DFP73DRAFT_541514 [Morchella snyderi]